MTIRDTLAAVLRAAHEETDSFGSGSDRPKVKQYLEDPDGSTFELFAYVNRIPFANFYAHSQQAFNKDGLWQEIERQMGGGKIQQPKKWDVTTETGEIALWLLDQEDS